MGRPSDYTPELAAAICEEIASGRSLRSICDDAGMPAPKTVYAWIAKYEDFSNQYAKAQSDRTNWWAEQIVEISDDSSGDFIELSEGKIAPNSVSVARDKLKVDTRKWLMSKMAPKKYGEKVALTDAEGGPVQFVIRDMTKTNE